MFRTNFHPSWKSIKVVGDRRVGAQEKRIGRQEKRGQEGGFANILLV